MRSLAALTTVSSFLACLCLTGVAHADKMDPAIERLVVRDSTGAKVPQPNSSPGREVYAPDNAAFAKLINQYAMAIAPTAMHSARTTGFGGFHLGFEASFTGITDDRSYWRFGTQGVQDPNNKEFSDFNASPDPSLNLYAIKIRKGFPLGLELGAQVGFLGSTNIVAGGADVRMSLLEGFRTGVMGAFPDIALGGGVRTISGTPQFNLTVASFDVQISKRLPVGDSNVITPYVGFQHLWIFGDSGLVDFSPGVDPVNECNYQGIKNPANPNNTGGENNGQPICGPGGSNVDFNNNQVFDKVRLNRQRFIIGLNYQYEMVFLGLQMMSDISDPESVGKFLGIGGNEDNGQLAGEQRQTTFAVEVGTLF